ncbi:MAG: hypothetical protein JWM74_5741, partial [Myxococcaceae bacterium]|nr:hypothetical protein [Myxococcaceae bacterium]
MRSASLFLGLALLAFAGCSSSEVTPTPSSDAAAAGDTGTPTGDGGSADTSTKTDAGGSGFASCDAACKTMALAAHVNAKTFPFERAQFGMSMNEAGVQTIHVEIYSGGSP